MEKSFHFPESPSLEFYCFRFHGTCSVSTYTDLLLCGSSSSSQGADSRDSQMNQALRRLENEHQELQAKMERLQGDREQQSSDTQDLQGTSWGSQDHENHSCRSSERGGCGEKLWSSFLLGLMIASFCEGKAGFYLHSPKRTSLVLH